jgi:TatD DNase family protein
MFHCFQGSIDILRKTLELGFYVGFDGNITYEGLPPGEKTKLPDLVKYAPLDRILTETDSPYLAPYPYRGKKNTPKNVIIVGRHIAQLKGIPYTRLVEQVYLNFESVFRRKVA